MSFAKPLWVLLAVVVAPALALATSPQFGGSSRLATFQDAGNHFFALSVQADPSGDYPLADTCEVVVVVDTSATQTGIVRTESLEVLQELALSLSAGTQVSLLACDVDTVVLSEGLLSPTDSKWETAVARLQQRIPLGTTDLGKALRTAAKQFSQNTAAQRTIIYIGDGINRTHFLSTAEHRQLVDELVAARITVSSLAIGPVVDLATLAALSNHTGGILLSRAEIEESTQTIGRHLGQSTSAPVLWIDQAQLPGGMASYFPQQFPPLRIDRDTVVVGSSNQPLATGKVSLQAKSAGGPVELAWTVEPEESNPDMGFLSSVLSEAKRDGGLTLPALGSVGLRAMSFMLADSAAAMVKAGQFALKSGQVESAIRIAEEALKQDPNNAEAISLLNAAKRLAEQSVPAGKFMQFENPFAPQPAAGDDASIIEDSPFDAADEVIPAPVDDTVVAPAPAAPAPTPQPPAFAPAAPAPSILDETFGAGDLLAEEQALRRAKAQALEADVRARLRMAQELASRDPGGVKNSLKLLLEELDNAVDIDASLRAQLREQVSSALQIVAVQEARFLDQVQRAEALRVQASQAQRLLAETNRQDEALKQLVEQFNYLMKEHRYLEASKDVAPEIGELAPGTVLDDVTREESSLAANQALNREAFERREQGYVDAMRGVEEAAVPFEGNPPLIYPPAEVWQALSARRKERYGAINLAGGNDSEQRIYSALKQEIDTLQYNATPLQQVLVGFKDDLNIPIWINQEELNLLGVDPDLPITLDLPPISLRSALRLMLEPHELTYIIRNEVLEITSRDSAESDPINKVYPVGDLVVPPMPMGGGMMGGGMMGGMGGGMGGMGGGMGGMGGGMGGMGGGMGGMGGGGMMGGGMGGMFAVPDDSAKSPSQASAGKPLPLGSSKSAIDVASWVAQLDAADADQRLELHAKIRRLVESKVKLAEAYLEAKDVAAAQGELQQVIGLIGGLLSGGHPQAWMYQALSLSMEACDYPAADIQRVLLSALDFEGDTRQTFKIAQYLARKGMKKEALDLLHDIAKLEPNRYDVFALALALADETQDVDALRWVCVGVLGKAWPKEHAALFDRAHLLARATKNRLNQEGRVIESKIFEEQINSAMLRDIVVRVNWTGDADLDIRVKEPAGTVCSLSNPQTTSGGVLLGDTSSSGSKASIDGYSEYYVCSQGYAGQYDVLIRRVLGTPSGGKATVEIYTDYGTPEQSYIVKQIDVSEKDAVLQVAVKNGHRQEPIVAAQLAGIRKSQMEAGNAVLGQLASSGSDDYDSYLNYRRLLAAAGRQAGPGFGFPVGGGAVGYRPVITTLPEGINMFVTGVVSADRRYVRISPSPNFSGIGEVFTFNFVSGTGGQQQGGGGFGGGVGGGVNQGGGAGGGGVL